MVFFFLLTPTQADQIECSQEEPWRRQPAIVHTQRISHSASLQQVLSGGWPLWPHLCL